MGEHIGGVVAHSRPGYDRPVWDSCGLARPEESHAHHSPSMRDTDSLARDGKGILDYSPDLSASHHVRRRVPARHRDRLQDRTIPVQEYDDFADGGNGYSAGCGARCLPPSVISARYALSPSE